MTTTGLSVRIRLDDRAADRVHVTVTLQPGEAPVQVSGVAVELFGRRGDSLGPRLLLPISGALTGPIATRAELRSREALPRGAYVQATAWMPHAEIATTCPAEPPPLLESYVRGRRALLSDPRGRSMATLSAGEQRCLSTTFPWLLPPREGGCDIDEVAARVGLDEDDAAWLRELMEE